MSISKKTVFTALMLLLVAMLLVGCSGQKPYSTTESTDSSGTESSTSGITGQAVSQSDLNEQVDSGFEDDSSEMEIGDMV